MTTLDKSTGKINERYEQRTGYKLMTIQNTQFLKKTIGILLIQIASTNKPTKLACAMLLIVSASSIPTTSRKISSTSWQFVCYKSRSLFIRFEYKVIRRVPVIPYYLNGNSVNTIPRSFRGNPGKIPKEDTADSRPDSGNGSRLSQAVRNQHVDVAL